MSSSPVGMSWNYRDYNKVNCLDRHAQRSPDKVALIWEKDEPGTEEEVTYGYAECKAVITCNQGLRGGRIIELKKIVDEAVKKCPSIKHVFVAQRTTSKIHMSRHDVLLEEEMAKVSSICPPEIMDSEDMLFMLYTSGSTGKPKGIVHTQAGYLLYAAITHKPYLDPHQSLTLQVKPIGSQPDFDPHWSLTPRGHTDWHTARLRSSCDELLARPLRLMLVRIRGYGCSLYTEVNYHQAVSIWNHDYSLYIEVQYWFTLSLIRDHSRYWETVERLKINQFYCAPTALRLLLKYGDEYVKKYDRSSLTTLGSETGGICIAPRPSEKEAEIIPAIAMRPFYGINPVLMDEKGNILEGGDVSGALCIAQPWPGMARTIYGDHQRFIEAYFKTYPGYYFTGDSAYRTKEGYYQITGRMDDVLNISGHRLGTAEIEDAMDEHPAVPETAVISYPHDIKGEVAFAFIILKDETVHPEVVTKELREIVSSKIAKYAVPDHILVVKRLPKTRSGKIMRRLLRRIVTGSVNDMGDITTLDDPSVIAEILDAFEKYKAKHPKF
ncbi:hypothetical protein JD844_025572 [Phrynosoma platyrhinos]|uniref:acetate--CoA ligase n=1 Tax=Phrynosoma platyrhinos TaxID=52577 RepID=A0ABQ7SZH9_PHRPL|nr:hypothetical protein JD844_025572 [Phrynosoma platyrhinos]